jgi:hypothetical protein
MRMPLSAAAFSFLAAAVSGAAAAPLAPEHVPRADASVRRALDRGEAVLDVIVGVRDGTPSPRALAAHPDPAGEPRRRAQRLAAQDALARAISPGALAVRHRYESFSALAGRATREGVLALANRRDVAWITLDAIRHRHQSSPQSAQVLIHSDRVNAAGIDGAGQTIAVLDTGVDSSVSELGGGGFPNAKVIGGADVADGDADPMDCEGHGTSVAAVAAGPAGVAPGARIVALKVARTASCDTAQDSDILAAIDWAVSNREAFGIGSINLSFGGAPPDGLDHGYCDGRLPHYATAVEAAGTAGIVFVASAGNEGLSNALAEPACLSGAISAGAVYPDSAASLAWGTGSGGTLCTDEAVAADTVACFSNSADSLWLLAPGAFWLAPTRGGALERFHGTSAAAPAVAGAVALLQQARPELSPGQIASLLRATGKPVVDPRNGILTPRLDALAAVELSPHAFASADGAAVPIPDSGGFAAATATISGFSGRLAGVHAVVEIEHEDPRQLAISLTGPDGTAVRLHDHSGQAQHPINAVYGKTRAAAESLSAFAGRPANGTWTLRVEDGTPLVSGSVRRFAIRLLPEPPAAPVPAGAPAQLLPLVGRVEGAKLFLSDVRLYNPGPQEKTFSLFYVAQGGSGAAAVRATRTVPAGRVLALDDVIGTEYGYADSLGQLTVLSSDTRFLVSSRAYTRGAGGAFGVLVPAADSAAGFGQGQTATVSGLASDARLYVNAGFTEVSGAPVSVRMDLLGADGAPLASGTRSAGANGTVFVTDIAGNRGLSALSNFRIDFTVAGGAGRSRSSSTARRATGRSRPPRAPRSPPRTS